MGLLIKGLLGSAGGVLIGVLAKTKNYAIAGLVPLFPTFALIAHYIVASERGIEALRATIVFACGRFFPILIYLLSLWYFTGIMRLPLALAGAVGCWGLCALAVNPRLEPFPLAQRAAAVDSE
ncbi:inner membrane protein [Klebsiella pneumoniae]|nr:inner membrane protein [Klebsiella pneumoniae]